jgi:glycosyltransferase involved in cell wall biosynthesis
MKFSLVTISFNQAAFLERTIRSVIEQDCAGLEYIIVDPGSTDGSREIIERFRPHFAHVVLEPDRGAADGLNKGFARATGDYFGFLNSDDVLLPGALREAAGFLTAHPAVDAVSGACRVIDADDRLLRYSFSDRFSLARYAFGTGVLIQPSTFFRASAWRSTRGFNIENRSSWDGELFVDMAAAGCSFARSSRVWSGYRLHKQSITGSAKLKLAQQQYHQRKFREIMKRDPMPGDWLPAAGYRILKYLETPRALTERVFRGPVYGRTSS